MKKKVFKYLGIKILIVSLGVMMFLITGTGLYDSVTKFKNDVFITYVDLFFVGSIFLLNLLSLTLVIFRSSKSILFLNIYYIYILIILIIAFLGNYIADELTSIYAVTTLSVSIVLVFIIFITNKFKYKEAKYGNIEFIGKHND